MRHHAALVDVFILRKNNAAIPTLIAAECAPGGRQKAV